MNKKGFTLVELLVTIGIITLVSSLGVYLVTNIINSSKEKTIVLAHENIKKGANLYSKEFFDEIIWSNNKSCISVEQLISKGYIRKDKAEDATHNYIIIEKDDNNTIVSETNSTGTETICEAVIKKKVSPPTNKDICKELRYNGNSQNLIKENIGDIYEVANIVGKNAGSYKVEVGLKPGYYWKDNTTGKKDVYCTIKKGIPTLTLNKNNQPAEQTRPTDVTLTSNVNGTLELKSSNAKYADATSTPLTGSGTNYTSTITINNKSNREHNTYITITLNPSDQTNYQTADIIYTIGKITDIKKTKPTATNYCKENLHYNSLKQTLTIKEDTGYTFYDNEVTNVGTYTVTAKLHRGFEWEDGTTNDITFECELKDLTYKIVYNGNGHTKGDTPSSTHIYGTAKDLTENGFIKTGYTFLGWSTTSDGDVEYQNKQSVINLIDPINDPDGTIINLYAKWRINKVYIKYSVNGGTIQSPTTENGIEHKWTTDSNGIISREKSGESATSTFETHDYGTLISSTGLANWNNSNYINITKTGYNGKTNAEWICLSGDCKKGTTFNHTTQYKTADICDASISDCTVVLGVNWVDTKKPTIPTYVAFYADQSGNYTSGTWTKKTVHTTITSTDDGSGVAQIQYSTDKKTWTKLNFAKKNLAQKGTTWSGTEEWTLKTRNNTYYFRACDNAGNCSDVSTTYNIKYDITVPKCSITSTTNSYSDSKVSVTVTCSDANSGCQTANKTETIGKDTPYTVTDKVGNSTSCTADISTRARYRTRTWNSCASSTTVWGGSCIYSNSNMKKDVDITGKASKVACELACEAYKPVNGWYQIACESSTTCTGGWNKWGSWNSTYCNASYNDCQSKTQYIFSGQK